MRKLLSLTFILAAVTFAISSAKAQNVTVFGDSIAAGSYTNGLSWANDLPSQYAVTNLAVSGETLVDNAADGSISDVASHQSQFNVAITDTNIFIFALGTNDGKTPNQAGVLTNFIPQYEADLNEIYENGDNPLHPLIYICTPVPVDPASNNNGNIDPSFVDSTGTDAGTGITAMVQSLAGYDGAQVIDLNDDLETEFFSNPAYYYRNDFADGIHPSLAGQQAIANLIGDDLVVAPEPSTWALLLGGLGLLAFWRNKVESSKKSTT